MKAQVRKQIEALKADPIYIGALLFPFANKEVLSAFEKEIAALEKLL